MAISKNVLLGGGIIAIGLFLGYKAKRVGKQVIAIGGIIPTKQKPASSVTKPTFRDEFGMPRIY